MSRKNVTPNRSANGATNGTHHPHDVDVTVGPFTVQPRILGRGAWSVVHSAIDNRTREEVVAKIISKAKLKEKGALTPGEELREVAIMRMLPMHRNLVRLYDMVETDKSYYVFLEKLPHGDLCDYILNAPNGRLPEPQCKKYLRQIVSGLMMLHGIGISHRDVKPENMLLDPHDIVKITDFGLAKRHPKSRNTVTVPEEMSRELVGTLRYAAPEMFMSHFRGHPYDSFISDIWSVGVCLYIMFTGSFPFSAGANADEKQTWDVLQSSELVIPTHISKDGIDLLKKLLSKEPRNRIRLQDIEAHPWLKGEASSQHRSSPVAGAAAAPLDSPSSVEALQQELARYREMVRALSEELNHERSLREKLERQLKESAHPTETSAQKSNVPGLRLTSSPQRQPSNSVTTPGKASSDGTVRIPVTPPTNSPKRVVSASKTRIAPSPTRKSAVPRLSSPNPSRGVSPTNAQNTPSRATIAAPQQQGLHRSSPVVRFGTPANKVHPLPPQRTGTPTRVVGASPISPVAQEDGRDLRIDQIVRYKGGLATVRFLGTTGFAEGLWIGLELADAAGLNDGSCFIDKKRYFTCPQGYGVFVRRSQITIVKVE